MTLWLRFGSCTILALLLAAWCGCSRRPVAAPQFSPGASARAAIEEFDANQDGSLDANELAKCPGLQAAKDRIDADRNGSLSEAEISARLAAYSKNPAPLTPLRCQVLLGGQPLAGVQVTLVPERFLGEAISTAGGVTDVAGNALLSISEFSQQGYSGVFCGLYRVQISDTGPSGQKRVPAKYNAETILGQEVAPDVRELEHGVVWNLSRR